MKASELRIGNWVKIKDKIFEDGWDIGYDIYKTNEFQITGFNDGSSMKDCKVICFYEIPSKMFGGFIHSGCRDIDIDPIPLTEEWLEKLGFTLGGYNMLFWYHEKLKGLDFAGINWADAEYPEYQFLNYGIGTEIYQVYYVHQLQNLYFALTGEELILTKNETN